MTIDLNTLLTNALTAAVQQALVPFTARIEQLERHRDELRDRVNQITYGNEGGPKFATVAEVDDQLENMDTRLDSIGRRVDRLLVLEEKLENVVARLDLFHTDMGEVEHKVGSLWERFNAHDDALDLHGARILKVEDCATKHGNRLERVEDRVEREIAAGTAHERINLFNERVGYIEADVFEIKCRLKFRNGDDAEPVSLEDVIRHHSEALAYLESKVEEIDESQIDEDYIRDDLIRPIVSREVDRALENFDIKEAIEMSDIDVGDLLNVERAVHSVMNEARVRIEF